MARQPRAVARMRQEYREFSRTVRALRHTADAAQRSGLRPNFCQLRSLLGRWVTWTGDTQESDGQLLFSVIATRCPVLAPVLRRVQSEHRQVAQVAGELWVALDSWEASSTERHEAFCRLLKSASDAWRGHIEVVENYILPVAMDYLSPMDWQQLEGAQAQRGGGHAVPPSA